MKKLLLFVFAICCMGQAMAQQDDDTLRIGFEVDALPHPQMDYTQIIDTGNYSFDGLLDNPPNSFYYTRAFFGKKISEKSFEGFTYSNIIDTIGIDSIKRRAAFPGSGHNGSAQYAVAHGMDCSAWYAIEEPAKPLGIGEPHPIYSLYVTNTTYDVLSMLHGDSISKKFGGATGTDPDWFLLTIKGYAHGHLADSTLFYLADFRSDTPTLDYIVKDWRRIELDNWQVDSLSFSLSSSDTDSTGQMRTPAYFCLDDIKSYRPTVGGIHEIYQNGLFNIYPNPIASSGGHLFFESQKPISSKEYAVILYNLSGEKVMQQRVNLSKPMALPQLPAGLYTLLVRNGRQQLVYSQKLLVQ